MGAEYWPPSLSKAPSKYVVAVARACQAESSPSRSGVCAFNAASSVTAFPA
jgi:hypothetical protein